MRNGFRVLSVGGIAVYVNWSWLIAIAIITWSVGSFYDNTFPHWSSTTAYVLGLVSGILLFATVLIHELAHSFTARANRLPVNTITLFIFGGVSNLTREPQNPRVELLVAMAGPLASVVLAAVFFAVYRLGTLPSQVEAVLGYLASVNFILAIFNLIPGFPLDGGRVLRAILWQATGSMRRATKIASSVGDFIGYLFIAAGLIYAFVGKDLVAGIWLAFIGWFLHNAATATWQHSVMDRVLMGVDVRRVMDPAPSSVGPSMSIEEVVDSQFMARRVRAVPVNGPDGNLIGLVTLSDVQHVLRDRWPSTPVREVMTPVDRLTVTAPDADLRQALGAMAENSFHQLPVVTDGRLTGMLDRGHVFQWIHMRELMQQREQST